MEKNVSLGFLAKKASYFSGLYSFTKQNRKNAWFAPAQKIISVDSLSIKATNHPRVPMTFSAAEWYTF